VISGRGGENTAEHFREANGKLRSVRIVIFSLLLLIVAFLSLGGRCFYLQHFRSDHFGSISKRQQQKLVTERAQRGEILDCRGRVLAASDQIEIIKAEPRVIKDPVRLARELSPILETEPIEIYTRITESRNPGFALLKRGATWAQCSAARKFYGIGTESDWQRRYPMGRLTSHVVGFASVDNRGLGGIELACERELRGLSRRNIFLADSRRRPIRLTKRTGVFSDGTGIILTIDATIQQFARAALVEQCESFEAESGIAIVAEPRTGAVLAMVSLPDFEPGEARSTDPDRFRNRATTDQFEPGSIFKPLATAIALDAGVINKIEKIFCEDGYYHGRGFGKITEYRGHRYGQMTVREILVKSSNIGMAKIGQKLGKKRLYKGLRLFGFGKRTGIDLPGEVEGLLRPPGKWTGYSVTRIPFGQEISTTAIQLVRAFCILANGGRSVRPFVIRAMVDNDGTVTKLKRPGQTGVGFVIKPEVARWVVTEALVGVVNEGTGKRAKLADWQVFGKTGTANIAKSHERGYSDNDYVASFISGAPAENPAIVVLVSIRKPNKKLGKGYTGGAVASPAAAKITEKTLNYLGVPRRQQGLMARGS
jgi:cell division protein FtsI/penicillin-binding protein 2